MKEPDLAKKKSVSLAEVYHSVQIPVTSSSFRRFLAFVGPGLLISVGYMDPGNWETDLQGGAQYGFGLLSVVLISSVIAMFVQYLSLKLGIVTGTDLAQACRINYPSYLRWPLWILCEIAIAACDLAEVLGAAIALELLFGIPMIIGCLITSADVFVVLWLQKRSFHWAEALVAGLIAVISVSFGIELYWSGLGPEGWHGLVQGFWPTSQIVTDKNMLWLSVGIIGATVMPHNLYLHSAIVQTRNIADTDEGKKEAIRMANYDSCGSLTFALFVNAAILILAAVAFHWSNHQDVAQINKAYELLTPILGGLASTIFAIALLASGLNSAFTGTLAGQVVLEGFTDFRMPQWLRRLVSRLAALIPAIVMIGIYGENQVDNLMEISQVVLSLQLSFAVWPLLRFTNNRTIMGDFVNVRWVRVTGWVILITLIVLNSMVVWDGIEQLLGVPGA